MNTSTSMDNDEGVAKKALMQYWRSRKQAMRNSKGWKDSWVVFGMDLSTFKLEYTDTPLAVAFKQDKGKLQKA